MTLHDDLLGQAAQLLAADPRRPRQANLRRAVSAAFYALFHLLVHEASSLLVSGERRTLRQALARAFHHLEMHDVCKGLAAGTPRAVIQRLLPHSAPSAELVAVAAAFVDLQQARHEADYDLSASFQRTGVKGLIQQAEMAFAAWRRVRGSEEGDVFLVCLLALQRMRN